jgi:hypothetical protein
MTSGSSGWLADQFIKQCGKRGSPDGLVNYESVLLGLNAEASSRSLFQWSFRPTVSSPQTTR